MNFKRDNFLILSFCQMPFFKNRNQIRKEHFVMDKKEDKVNGSEMKGQII